MTLRSKRKGKALSIVIEIIPDEDGVTWGGHILFDPEIMPLELSDALALLGMVNTAVARHCRKLVEDAMSESAIESLLDEEPKGKPS